MEKKRETKKKEMIYDAPTEIKTKEEEEKRKDRERATERKYEGLENGRQRKTN